MSDRPEVPGMPPAPLPQNVPPLWLAWEATIVDRLLTLEGEVALTVSASPDLARPAKLPGLGRRLLGRQYEDVAPWIRFVRTEDHLIARCISDHKDLGFPMSPQEKAALADLGWHEPGESDGPELLRWFPDDVPSAAYLPVSDAAAAARLASLTFTEVFGVEDPATLHLST